MELILSLIVAGLFLGAFFGLVAVGYSMVYGVLRLINFAHGDFYMVAAYACYTLLLMFGISGAVNWGNFIAVGLVTMVIGGLLAVTIERLIYRSMRSAATLSLMIAALGVSLVLENGVLNLPFWGSEYRAFPVTPPTEGFELMGVHLAWVQVVIIGISIALTGLVYWVVNRTLVGMAMRAVSQDRVAAQLMGIEIDRIIAIVFFIGGALAGAAAVMASLYYGQIFYLMGFYVGLQAFTAAVLGGIGNVLGAAVGGFLLGILQAIGTGIIGPQWALLLSFSVLVITLWVRPTGLLGERVGQRV